MKVNIQSGKPSSSIPEEDEDFEYFKKIAQKILSDPTISIELDKTNFNYRGPPSSELHEIVPRLAAMSKNNRAYN